MSKLGIGDYPDRVKDFPEVFGGVVSRFDSVSPHLAEHQGTLAVLRRCDLFEVRQPPVQFVAVDMVDLHSFGSWSFPHLPHETVAVHAVS